jgi:hypothetical protein
MSARLGSLAFGLEKPMERQPANAYDVWSERIREWLRSSRGQPGTEDFLADSDIDRLVADPPLLFFLLFEAAYVPRHGVPDAVGRPTGGAHLGPVGSIITGETVCGALTRHPVSFENSGPTLAERLQECCSALLGSAHGQVLAGLAHINTMPELICYMLDKGLFGVSPPDAQHTGVLR